MDIAEILREVIASNASDLHLAVGVPPVALFTVAVNVAGCPTITGLAE